MPRLGFSGFDRADETRARGVFQGLGLSGWSLSDETSADAVLIDLDSIYGQMAWMKGVGEGQVSIGLTRAMRADTAYRLDAPLEAEALAAALRSIGIALGQVQASLDEAAPLAAVVAQAVDAAPVSAPVTDPIPETPRAALMRLAERIAVAAAPFAVQVGALPRLVVDPQRQQFAPGKSLKALQPYATAELPDTAITALHPDDTAEALAAAGDPQPLPRLVWLLALAGGQGRLHGHGASTRFQLGKWPQVEREFPKHFRIATVMLKAPATVAEIALTSGAGEAEVADYVNAALAAGYASAS